jgi:hypothetical protein
VSVDREHRRGRRDFFGESVAVGGTTAVGGAWDTLGDIGAAYIFVP